MGIVRFLKDWTLPVAIITGTVLYLVFAYVPALDEASKFFAPICKTGLPVFMFLVLFVTFCKVDFHKLRPVRWHWCVGLFQILFVAITVGLILAFDMRGNNLILLEALLISIILERNKRNMIPVYLRNLLVYSLEGEVGHRHLLRIGVRDKVATQEIERLPERFEQESADELVVALEAKEQQQLQPIIYSLYKYKCPIKIWADKSTPLSRLKIKTVEDVPLIDLTDNHFLPVEQNVKWLMDKVISLLALIVLSPLFGYIAWRVKQDSKGPVFFRQERIGYMGKPFLICKFRTMYVDAEKEGPLLSSEDDPRITPFGCLMRKYRLDELPQFWNVLKGDMSLVGPRPERASPRWVW